LIVAQEEDAFGADWLSEEQSVADLVLDQRIRGTG
jgi:hypothetical protein